MPGKTKPPVAGANAGGQALYEILAVYGFCPVCEKWCGREIDLLHKDVRDKMVAEHRKTEEHILNALSS